MPAATRVVLNHVGMGQMLKSSGVAAEMHRRAENVAAAARGDSHDDTGAYQNSITVIDEIHPTRAVSHVSADVEYAPILEAKYGILGRALDAAAG